MCSCLLKFFYLLLSVCFCVEMFSVCCIVVLLA